MSATTVFLQTHAQQLEAERRSAAARLVRQQDAIRDDFQQHMDRLDKNNEQFLAFAQPILEQLSQLPEGVSIVSLKPHLYLKEVELVLKGSPDVSLANVLLEYPALEVVHGPDGQLREVGNERMQEPVYKGVFVDAHKPHVHWDTRLGGQVVRVVCQMEHANVVPWKNPVSTGAPVADVHVGNMGEGPWIQVGTHHHHYWVQPANDAAVALLHDAVQWRQKERLHQELRAQFDARLSSIAGASFGTAQGRIVANSLFAWATSLQELPQAKDFLVWAPHRSNVLVMHTKNDWGALLADAPEKAAELTDVQQKMKLLSEKLPSLWRFVNQQGLDALCLAMDEVQSNLRASQSTSVQLQTL